MIGTTHHQIILQMVCIVLLHAMYMYNPDVTEFLLDGIRPCSTVYLSLYRKIRKCKSHRDNVNKNTRYLYSYLISVKQVEK